MSERVKLYAAWGRAAKRAKKKGQGRLEAVLALIEAATGYCAARGEVAP